MNASKWARWFTVGLLALVAQTGRFANLAAQAGPETVAPLLEKPVQSPALTAYQLRRYMMQRAAKPVLPASAEEWTRQAQAYRQHILHDVAFHG